MFQSLRVKQKASTDWQKVLLQIFRSHDEGLAATENISELGWAFLRNELTSIKVESSRNKVEKCRKCHTNEHRSVFANAFFH